MPTLEETIAMIGPPDAGAMERARERQARLTKPPGSLALLEDVAVRIAGMRGEATPALRSAVVIVVAGDHGVVAQGVSAYPQAVTAQMMANFIAGGAAICVLARQAAAKLVLVEAGIIAPAKAEVGAGADVFLPGDMGIGNTTAASAMTAALLGLPPGDVVGPGTDWTRQEGDIRQQQ